MARTNEKPPWLFGPVADVAVFGGSAALGLTLVGARRVLGIPAELPEWGFLAFVVGVDVAHVYATLFRTYFDRDEIARHPARYALIPLFLYLTGVGLHLRSSHAFWRVLAYLAVFHFVRQQAGWAALYRSRAGVTSRVEAALDSVALYSATVYPLVYWHAHLRETHFNWFIDGDFADVSSAAARLLPAVKIVWIVALAVFVLRRLERLVVTRRFETGRALMVATTAATWYVGIVATNSDFDFTVTNVLAHGIPYFALVFSNVRARRAAGFENFGTDIAAQGFGAFAGLLVTLAFVEEAVWDRLVWHDHPWLFGHGTSLGVLASALVVPLLAVPQTTHYVLDGLIWRRKEKGFGL
jgi:hypothetical protein